MLNGVGIFLDALSNYGSIRCSGNGGLALAFAHSDGLELNPVVKIAMPKRSGCL